MGTGKPAAVDGQMAAKLTAQLLQAGFAAEALPGWSTWHWA